MISGVIQAIIGSYPILTIVLILTVIYIIISWSNQPRNIPPVPERPYPFLGHVTMLAKGPRRQMKEWGDKTGDIFSFYNGSQLNVVLNSFGVMKEALVKQAHIFSDRPTSFIQNIIPGGRKGILVSSGEMFKEQRTVSLSILRAFGMGKSSLVEKVDEEVDVFLNELIALKGKPSDFRTLISNCVSNVICNIIVGKRFELGDPDFLSLLKMLNENVTFAAKAFILNTYPWLSYVPGDPFKANKMVDNSLKMMNFFNQHFIEPLSKTAELNEADCFITAYVQEMKKRERSGKPTTLDKESLARNIFFLFAAGSETTSTTILWFILEMLHHPDVLGKIHKEIDDVVGANRRPDMQDRSKMKYLSATIMELQRKSSIVPFSLQHLCNQTTTVGGYTIPKGTVIIPNLDSVLLDEKIWKDPLEFRPERFLDDSGNLLSFEEFVPFSLGRRVCLGESLAKMELFLFIANICQRFDIKPVEKDTLPPLKHIFGVTAAPEAYEVRFIQRL